MGVDGRIAVIKYLIFIFNLLFCLSSLCLVAVGALMLSDSDAVLSDAPTVASLCVMALGLVVFLVSFFGCCGAQRESHCMMATFSALMFLIFFLELGLGVTAYFFRHQVRELVEVKVWKLLEKHPEATVDDLLGKMQTQLKCCGVTSFDNWFASSNSSGSNSNSSSGRVPDSCCIYPRERCGDNVDASTASAVIYTEGCLSMVESILLQNALLVGGVALGLALIQIISIILACCLMKGIRDFHKYDVAEFEPCPASKWDRGVTLE
ncbi:CD63 antigen-like [Petromyzon marinus]|uniref:CD63 antigen-like n=1 Tax=Petromyzon marinus TaxID=7757 RepID=UPI003F71AF47